MKRYGLSDLGRGGQFHGIVFFAGAVWLTREGMLHVALPKPLTVNPKPRFTGLGAQVEVWLAAVQLRPLYGGFRNKGHLIGVLSV